MLFVRTFLTELHAWEWIGILVARLAVGSLFFLSGRGKLFVPERREQMRETLVAARVPFPEFNTLLVSAVEFVFGLLLILGAITPLACVMLSGIMSDCDYRDSKYKSDIFARPALRILVSSRGALSRDPSVAVSLWPRVVQHRSPDTLPPVAIRY